MNNKELIEAGFEMAMNFKDTLEQAGGRITLSSLHTMTAFDLLILLSTNNIKLRYEEWTT